jgi:hypothetical protein
MPYLTVEELTSHIDDVIINEISQDDQTIAEEAINAAITEVKSALTAYDTEIIFSTTGNERNPIVLLYTKDVAVWHFIQRCNIGTDWDKRKQRYDLANKWLDKVQSGSRVPDLPVPPADSPDGSGQQIKHGSNPKRKNHY